MTLLTRSADFASLVSVLAFATIVLWLRRRFLDAAFILASVAGATSLNLILKEWFYRPRPDLWPHLVTEFGYSFPSGHAMMSSALVFAVVWLVWHSSRRWLAVGLGALYMVGVGFSRLYLGVHYPTDVVAGWCFSLLWVLIVAAALYGRWIGLGRFGR
jgi:membrane-associated phospholipid phosphatase